MAFPPRRFLVFEDLESFESMLFGPIASESTGLRQAFAKRGPTAGFLKQWIRDICWNEIFLLLTDL